MDDEIWFDATHVGSQFQVETSDRGRWRFRPLQIGWGQTIDYPWQMGKPEDFNNQYNYQVE